MLHLALTPRWIIGFIALAAFTVAAIFLGRWQWDRTQTILEAERAAAAAPVAVSELLDDPAAVAVPDGFIGRPVEVSGAYDSRLQVVVTNRSLDGKPGAWVVTGLRLADDRVVAVVRGWVSDADDPALAVPEGAVSVTGVLHPSEGFFDDAVTDPGTVVAIDSEGLSALWKTDMTPGYVMLTAQTPMRQPAPAPVPPTVQTADVPFPLQNFFYAFQWWLFAAFGWVVYFRWLWLESRRARADVH